MKNRLAVVAVALSLIAAAPLFFLLLLARAILADENEIEDCY